MTGAFEGYWAGPQHGVLGVVLVHGFTGSPWDMRLLADALGGAGVPAHVPLLAGHDRGVLGVAVATLDDWRRDVDEAVGRMERQIEGPVAVVGQSMGGLLALDLALREPTRLAGVGSLAAPLTLARSARAASRLASGLGSFGTRFVRPKTGGSDISTREALPGPDGIPLRALHELFVLMDAVAAGLAQVRSPLLVLHARRDHTADVRSAWRLATGAGSANLRLVILDEGFHVITRDVCHLRVEREVVDWANGLGAAAGG